MTKEIKISIPGKPVAKKRPRFARRGKFVMAYNDQQTEEGRFLLELKQQWSGHPIDGPLDIEVWFFMPRPKCHFGTGKNAGILKDSAPKYHTKKADIDNLLKFVFDCFNGVVWNDDTQVVGCNAVKTYAKGGAGTRIIVREIKQ